MICCITITCDFISHINYLEILMYKYMQESFVVKFLLLNIDEFECFTVGVVGKEGYFFMLTHLDHGGIYLVFG